MRSYRDIEDLKKNLSSIPKPKNAIDLKSSNYIDLLVSLSTEVDSEFKYYCMNLLFSCLENFEGSQEHHEIIENLVRKSHHSSSTLSHVYFKLCMTKNLDEKLKFSALKAYITISSRIYSNSIDNNSKLSDLNYCFVLCMSSSLINIDDVFESSLFMLYDFLDDDLYEEEYSKYYSVIVNNRSYLSHIIENCASYPDVQKHLKSIRDLI